MQKTWILLSALLAACIPAFAAPLSIHGEPAVATKSAVAPKLRLAPLTSPTMSLGTVTDAELARVVQSNRTSTKRMAIGIERSIGETRLPSARDLQWKAVDGGSAAQLAIRSPEAGAVRIALDLAGVPADVQIVAFGSANPSRLEGPTRVGDVADRTQPWWSPVTDGEIQTLELFAPSGIDGPALSLHVTGVSHLFTTLASGLKAGTGIGASGSCEIDVKCSTLYPTLPFQNIRNSVAEMVVHDAGEVFSCGGQLLNDTDGSTQIPWFFSGDHCFDNENAPFKTAGEMQTVASTISTIWFFEAVTCSNPPDETTPAYVQLNGGSTMVYSNQPSDGLMVRLNGAVPAGVFFAGWNATPIPSGSAIVVAHHPEGDLKKVTQGTSLGVSRFPGSTNSFNEVRYSPGGSGTTEPGSSGSGLFTYDGAEYQLRGALFGGAAACNALTGHDWYSQFDKIFPNLEPYLSPAAVPAFDYTDLWWNSNESGWGLNLVQHASHQVFGVWFTYATNGNPTWYTMPGGAWTSPGTFTGNVYATTGPSAAAATFNGSSVVVRQAGTATLNFSDANNGTFAYTVDGVTGSKVIARQPY